MKSLGTAVKISWISKPPFNFAPIYHVPLICPIIYWSREKLTFLLNILSSPLHLTTTTCMDFPWNWVPSSLISLPEMEIYQADWFTNLSLMLLWMEWFWRLFPELTKILRDLWTEEEECKLKGETLEKTIRLRLPLGKLKFKKKSNKKMRKFMKKWAKKLFYLLALLDWVWLWLLCILLSESLSLKIKELSRKKNKEKKNLKLKEEIVSTLKSLLMFEFKN